MVTLNNCKTQCLWLQAVHGIFFSLPQFISLKLNTSLHPTTSEINRAQRVVSLISLAWVIRFATSTQRNKLLVLEFLWKTTQRRVFCRDKSLAVGISLVKHSKARIHWTTNSVGSERAIIDSPRAWKRVVCAWNFARSSDNADDFRSTSRRTIILDARLAASLEISREFQSRLRIPSASKLFISARVPPRITISRARANESQERAYRRPKEDEEKTIKKFSGEGSFKEWKLYEIWFIRLGHYSSDTSQKWQIERYVSLDGYYSK